MRKQRIVSVLTACALLAATPSYAFGAMSDYDAETAARLQDNKLEYDEIGNLLREYNPQMKYSYQQIQLSEDETASTVREMRDYLDENGIKDALKSLKESKKQIEAMPDSPVKTEMLISVEQGIMGYNAMLSMPGTTTTSTDKSLEKVKKQLDTGIRQMTVAVESMMISYDNLSVQEKTLEKVVDLQTASLEAAKLQTELNMATDVSVYQAESSLLASQKQLEALRSGKDALKSQLCLMTGWAADASPEISSVPAAQPERLSSIDLQSDIQKAVGNNQTLIGMRHSRGDKSTVGRNLRDMTMEEAEQKLKIEMQRLYQDLQQKKIAYDAASVSWQKAQLANAAAERQYQYQMISRIQYLGTQVQYCQAEGAVKAADTALLQAFVSYDAAVDGFVTIPN